MNKVLIVGNLVSKPLLSETKSGINYARFTIAVNRNFGEESVDFIPVTVWRQQAKFVCQYGIKGSKLSIEGRFSSSTYKNSNNDTITRYEVSAERVNLIDSKAETERKLASSVTTKKISDKNFSAIKKDEIAQTQDIPMDLPWELDL